MPDPRRPRSRVPILLSILTSAFYWLVLLAIARSAHAVPGGFVDGGRQHLADEWQPGQLSGVLVE